jgi:outer membrane autotransporter protein
VAGGIGAGGTATLGGVLQLTPTAGSPTIADGSPIVATGGVSGRFAAVTGEAPGARFALDYQSDRVVLVPLQNGFVDLARTGNEHAVATVLDALTDPPTPLVDVLSARPIGSIAGDLANLSGAAYTVFEANAVSATRSFQAAIAARMGRAAGQEMGLDATAAGAVILPVQTASPGDRSGFGGLLAAAGATATDATATSSAMEVRVRPWVETYGRSYQLNSANGAPGMHATGGAVMIGADAPLDGSLDRSAAGRSGLGAALAYDFADVSATTASAPI